MAKFYNPYHFIPVAPPGHSHSVQREEFSNNRELNATHERFVPKSCSGRLLLRLTTVTPVVVGNTQNRPSDKDYATIHPYLVNDIPAIPGSSLRGLIGSVIETATNGPLRVLHDQAYSYRQKMGSSLSAIGLIVEINGELRLRPMCLPTLESKDGGRSFQAPARFRKIFPTPQFKVYFGDQNTIRDPSFPYRTHLAGTPPVDMPVKQLAWNGNSVLADRTLRVKGGRYLVAQNPDARDPKRPGRVRVLGCWPQNRLDEIPNTKKHELWIPEPAQNFPLLPISKTAIDRFNALADERTNEDNSLPFEPLDTRPGRSTDPVLRLKAGDMVFFDVNDAGTEVAEFSFSAIWRGRVEDPATREPTTTWKFFAGIDPELLPANPSRKSISPAELLLGFADDVPKELATVRPPQPPCPTLLGFADDVPEELPSGLALASRVGFADALPASGDRNSLLLPQVVLKILGSPKPPCPAFYFRPKTGSNYIEKSQLNSNDHKPQGRKWYLHARPDPGAAPWASGKPNDPKTKGQKSKVTPIKAGTSFYFHVDFDNLSPLELGLLLFALEPDPSFHHKIGMGKPLGLGSVKIEVIGYFPVDRIARYSVAGLRAERYQPAVLTEA
jgi:CRISPR-associated protein (TIGR03986 family)